MMTVKQPYHKYVFDIENRKYVGRFEEMYANEEREKYDSWHQEDLSHLGKQISYLMISRHGFNCILDLGCGKGAFSHLLKRENNRVVGADISKTAVEKANKKYIDIEFFNLTASQALAMEEDWDLIIMMEILSYLDDWKTVLAKASQKGKHVFVSIYLPPDPVGFIKKFNDLKEEFVKYFEIISEVLWNNDTLLILGKSVICE